MLRFLNIVSLMSNFFQIFVLIISFFVLSCSSKQTDSSNQNISKDKPNTVSGMNSTGEKKSDNKNVQFKTSDGLTIDGSFFYASSKENISQPLVILIHQFRQTKEQWTNSFIDSLISTGCKVLAYDIRGHGKSSKVDYDLTKLLEDADKAPKDLDAIFDWTKKQKGEKGREGRAPAGR